MITIKKRLLLIIALVLLILIVIYPFKFTVVPEWKIRVIDETGKEFPNARVLQQWDHLSLGVGDGEERWTNEDGYVVFPERTIRASLLYRVLRTSWAAVMTMAHGSSGIRATVWATTPKVSSEFLEYKQGKPLPKEIVLQR